MHIACIPRSLSPPSIPLILFVTLQADEHWEEDGSIAVHSLGCIWPQFRTDLQCAAEAAIDSTTVLDTTDVKVISYQDLLVLLLQQLVSYMNYLQAVPSRALAVAAHIQRLALELAGLKTYLTVVVPCIQSLQDFSHSVLDVVGSFL